MTRQPQDNPNALPPVPALHEQDAQAVDHLLGGETGVHAPPERLAQLQAMNRLLDQWQAEAPPLDLKNRTLARLKEAREQSRRRTEPLKLSFAPGKLTEVAAVAAIVLIAFSLAVPMLVRARDHERQAMCQSNLRQVGEAFGAYAADFGDVLPRGQTIPSDSWWRVGQAFNRGDALQSNSANLYLLARQGYVGSQTMACPDNLEAPRKMSFSAQDWPDAPAVSYSYQNQYTPRPYNVTRAGDMVILADKNPLFKISRDIREGMTYRKDLQPNAPTPFHKSRGQNVLDATGFVGWTTDPVMPRGQDNIWLARNVAEYRGNEVPSDENDSFLVP